MIKRFILFLTVFLLFFGFVFAIDFTFEKRTLFKGDTLIIDGSADSTVIITATSGTKNIFSSKVQVSNNKFSFRRAISFLDPAGEWKVELSDSTQTEFQKINVKPSRESQFLLVSFLSPPPINFPKTSIFNLAVKITDSSQPVGNASVFFWTVDGEMLGVNNNHDGTYSTNYQIPVGTKGGNYDLTVIAKANSEEYGTIGGENSIQLFIEPSAIEMEVIKPKGESYAVGDPLEIEIKMTYADGSPVENTVPLGVVNFEVIRFSDKGNGIYTSSFIPREIKNDVFNISINVIDEFENMGETHFSLKPQGFLQWAFKENAILYIFPLLLLFYILVLSAKELSYFYRVNSARNKKHALLALKQRLQENFYKKSVISEKSFNSKNFELNMQLDKVEGELKKLSKSAK